MSEPTLNQRWAAHLVGALVASGVRHAVVAPGSRSTPLALAFADRPDVRTFCVLDERSAGFFALGLSKADGRPAAIVCTSGTAGAHLLPAVMEASAGGTPLVVLTADRPWELHGFGAPQTTRQAGLFQGFTRDAEALPSPDEHSFEHLVAVVARVVAASLRLPGGPVHLNAPFREPLVHPDGAAGPLVDPRVARFSQPTATPAMEHVIDALTGAERPLLVCGPREQADGFAVLVHELGARLGAPVLAEAASNVRYGFSSAISRYETILRAPRLAQALAPDVVVRFGGGLTLKALQEWLDTSGAQQFHVVEQAEPRDPNHRATEYLAGSAVAACQALLGVVSRATDYRRSFEAAQALATVAHGAQLDEPLAAKALVEALPDGAALMLSSSMPVRDVDAFATDVRGQLHVFSNRGLNGIDGVTSTALGIAAARRRPTALLIGDVALLHDLSAWPLAARHELNLVVVVLNNDGGGIFHFLPVNGRTPHFERLFGTPHGVDLSAAAQLGGARLHRPTDLPSYRAALALALEGGLHLIEVRTNRVENVSTHRDLNAAAVARLEATWR